LLNKTTATEIFKARDQGREFDILEKDPNLKRQLKEERRKAWIDRVMKLKSQGDKPIETTPLVRKLLDDVEQKLRISDPDRFALYNRSIFDDIHVPPNDTNITHSEYFYDYICDLEEKFDYDKIDSEYQEAARAQRRRIYRAKLAGKNFTEKGEPVAGFRENRTSISKIMRGTDEPAPELKIGLDKFHDVMSFRSSHSSSDGESKAPPPGSARVTGPGEKEAIRYAEGPRESSSSSIDDTKYKELGMIRDGFAQSKQLPTPRAAFDEYLNMTSDLDRVEDFHQQTYFHETNQSLEDYVERNLFYFGHQITAESLHCGMTQATGMSTDMNMDNHANTGGEEEEEDPVLQQYFKDHHSHSNHPLREYTDDERGSIVSSDLDRPMKFTKGEAGEAEDYVDNLLRGDKKKKNERKSRPGLA